MSCGLDVRPEVKVLVLLHADRQVAGQRALLRRRQGRGEVAAAVVAVPPPHDLRIQSRNEDTELRMHFTEDL